MRIILETTQDKIFINYEGAAISSLLRITKGNVLEPLFQDQQMGVRYADKRTGKVITLHMSKYLSYGIHEAEQLSNALDSGIQDNETYQLERIISQSLPFDEGGLPGVEIVKLPVSC